MSSISVFGLGYVGCVSAACFAKEGHDVIGVDVSASKVAMINAGKSTIVEEGIAELVLAVHQAGRLRATTSVTEAIAETTISLIAVGTPSRSNGSIDLQYIERVAEQIGTALATKDDWHTVVIRSTVMPGTIDDVVIPALERTSGRIHGNGFAVCSNPEFLREGTSIKDFYDPPFTLVGAQTSSHASPVMQLYEGLDVPSHVVSVRVAEMVKYACNCFHGLKVGFANEIGNLCKALNVDSHEVMRIFCDDRKLNISPAYLKPGYAFGGSCLPKDIRAITHRAKSSDLDLPIMQALLESNRQQVERAFRLAMSTDPRSIGILGLSFKQGTDDLRESPLVWLIELFIGKGKQVRVFDPLVRESGILGTNREFITREIPHIWELMVDSAELAVESADLVVIGNAMIPIAPLDSTLRKAAVLDLVRTADASGLGAPYIGIAW